MAPTLNHYFTMRGYISQKNSHELKVVLGGPTRVFVPIVSGFIEGQGLKADILPGGGDWILLDQTTNVAHIDVRTQARTSEDYSLYIHYTGILKLDEKAQEVLSWKTNAKTTNFGDHLWFNGPIIETNDPKLKWVENELWIGQGRFVVDEKGSAVEYQIYKVCN